jgi:flagellin-like hook-associated protein FlgL
VFALDIGIFVTRIGLGTNIFSLGAQRRLAEGSAELSKTFERLSSGLRINRASDDAAGLAIASTLKADARVFTQAIRNVNDGISALSIASGAIDALTSIVIRQKELAEQAAHGTYTFKQRQAAAFEANELVDEFNRIAATTTFNGVNLFDTAQQELRIQAGIGESSGIALDLGSLLARTTGDGTFGAPITLISGDAAVEDVIVDINNDGKLDLITGTNARVFLGNGDGTFRASLDTGVNNYNRKIVDINGDGKLDIAYTNLSTEVAGVQLGNGDGTFRAAMSFPAGSGGGVRALAVGDINGDGELDFVTGSLFDATIRTFFGNGDGTFAVGTSFVSAGPRAFQWLTDFNSDGKLDLFTVGAGETASMLLGNGDGTFKAALSLLVPGSGYVAHPTIGDYNNDGFMDAAIGSGTGVGVFISNGDGTFKAALTSTIGYANSPVSGDVNGDGIVDLITNDMTTGTQHVLIGNGNGTFRESQQRVIAVNVRGGAIGDLNNDGAVDMLFGADTVATYISYGNTTEVVTEAYLDLFTQSSARNALDTLSGTLDRLSRAQGGIGAMQSRLEFAHNLLATTRENYLAAASRIEDADIAQETANLTRQKILQQTTAAILGQANLQPQLVLSLLS